jgi:predicted flap endonuclease-1-like 5' DNA nuclease
MADLFRIKGIGEEYSDLLKEAGVSTVVELARRNPKNLHETIMGYNEAKKLVRRPPSLTQVIDWIEQAKILPRMVEY